MNLKMTDKISKLECQLNKIKKCTKYTNIRELQNQNERFI